MGFRFELGTIVIHRISSEHARFGLEAIRRSAGANSIQAILSKIAHNSEVEVSSPGAIFMIVERVTREFKGGAEYSYRLSPGLTKDHQELLVPEEAVERLDDWFKLTGQDEKPEEGEKKEEKRSSPKLDWSKLVVNVPDGTKGS